ncbi:uncharacterized protein A1O9_02042 [Exophiala aquamarina CBS 119918]|uniref:SAP domain-containing protein n=1 Tax=Exophiala aquamarina CBS 119918 TaxID=1182545 RepID=A0A072PKS6_9EURO|nr:uncharacterized protein A1O9_02042 [Exophiala aquamarina CBS 119918]KEF60481.1 hypothetical protein A1O9_02042 [Exophiala aquamarina CBS 119918]
MTDWGKSKVADLKEECKSRGIPLTGLKLKQQYIDKLQEYEGAQEIQNSNESENANVISPEETQPTTPKNETPDSQPSRDSETNKCTGESNVHADKSVSDQGPISSAVDETQDHGAQDQSAGYLGTDTQHVSAQEPMEGDKPVEQQKEEEDVQAEDAHSPTDTTPANGYPTDKKPLLILGSDQVQVDVESINAQSHEAPGHLNGAGSGVDIATLTEDQKRTSEVTSEQSQEALSTIRSKFALISSDTSTPTSSQTPEADLLDDRKNRRKRSLTPVPMAEEMARKKVRLSDAAEDATKEPVSSERFEAPAHGVQETQGGGTEGKTLDLSPQHSGNGDSSTAVRRNSVSPGVATIKIPPVSPPESRGLSEERDVPAALHPATCSLYIRNLKRPLHIPTLRSHIVSLAQAPDPITIFFLDSIRTHAFISFTSVAAASRVRTAMHDTRFPDEAMREPLFVDYIPDDKVQPWIDEETGGNSFGGRAGGKRFEVIYDAGRHGDVEAIFQEVDTRNPQPPLPRPSLTSRTSIDIGRPRLETRSQEVHPDRAALVSNPTQYDRPPPSRASAQSRPNNSGVGFKALDDLFPSTTTKPKLYFKPAPDDVVQDRMNMLRDLRVEYSEMGRSGDEGMKRYSFELYKTGREEWVDKGPEFGFGRKGQDRLTGFRGRGGGGYRGRGGDSWRGAR